MNGFMVLKLWGCEDRDRFLKTNFMVGKFNLVYQFTTLAKAQWTVVVFD